MAKKAVILLVEDELPVRNLMLEMLHSSGYIVLSAGSAADAIRVFTERKGRISLLLTDVDLGEGSSGIELAKRLEAMCPELRVVHMSGSPEHSIGCQGKRHFVRKPFALSALLGKIEEVLRFDCGSQGKAVGVADQPHSV